MDNYKMYTHVCPQCKSSWLASSPTLHCGNCECAKLFSALSESDIEKIDAKIFGKKILEGISLFREKAGVSLQAALELYYWRYNALRKSHPDIFQHTPDEYWQGFHS